MEKTVEVGKHIRQEGMQSYTVEQIVGVPLPQTRKEIRDIPQERISYRVVEQTAYIPSPKIPQEEERLFSWNRVDQRQRDRERRAVHRDGTHVAGCTERNAKLNDMRGLRREVAEVCP